MRAICLSLAVLAASAFAVPAMAYENYIPLGTGYSSNVTSLPQFDSEEGIVASRTDVYESEIYRKARKNAEDDSRFQQFFSNSDRTGGGSYIDY